jgi:leucyl-tRNA synthetase
MGRTIRGGLIQVKADVSLEGSTDDVKKRMIDKHLPLIVEAGRKGVQVLCLQELFYGPYFCAEQKTRWYELTEPIPDPAAASEADRAVVGEALSALVRMLAPFAPHLASELWEQLGNDRTLVEASWPVYRDEIAREESIELPVQVNGKLRAKVLVAPDADADTMREAALADEKIAAIVADKEIAKVIVVPGRLVNVVVR